MKITSKFSAFIYDLDLDAINLVYTWDLILTKCFSEECHCITHGQINFLPFLLIFIFK